MPLDTGERTACVTAVMRSEESAASLQDTLSHLSDFKVETRTIRISDLDIDAFSREPPDAVIVEVEARDALEMTAVSSLIRSLPKRTVVVATATEAGVDDVRRLIRAGVSDFLPQPFTRSDLSFALEAVRDSMTGGNGRGRPTGAVYSFVGAAGGAGSTTLAIQTAAELLKGEQRRRHVALLDFDLQFGSIGVSLEGTANAGLARILQESERLDPGFLRGAMSRHRSGIDVLAAPASILPLDAMTPEIAEQILRLAREEYDYVIVDLPQAWTNWTLKILGVSDLIFMVTNLSVTALERTRRQFHSLTDHGLSAVAAVTVVNALEDAWGNRKLLKEAEALLGRKIDFCIRSDPKTARAAVERGALITEVKRRSRLEKDVRSLLQEAAHSLQKDSTSLAIPGNASTAI